MTPRNAATRTEASVFCPVRERRTPIATCLHCPWIDQVAPVARGAQVHCSPPAYPAMGLDVGYVFDDEF